MNNKYEEMSDFEINKRVFRHSVHFNKCEEVMTKPNPQRASFSWGDGVNWFSFDACNNPADMWPIIFKNKIETCWHSGEKWMATIDNQFQAGDFKRASYLHENPLRAAAIVFLMLKDGE